jgi:hypothetical protein
MRGLYIPRGFVYPYSGEQKMPEELKLKPRICFRCGDCCTSLWVWIVDDPNKPFGKSMFSKRDGVRCKHLLGDIPGKYTCAIHNKKWYILTNCYRHGLRVRSEPCETGLRILGLKMTQGRAANCQLPPVKAGGLPKGLGNVRVD